MLRLVSQPCRREVKGELSPFLQKNSVVLFLLSFSQILYYRGDMKWEGGGGNCGLLKCSGQRSKVISHFIWARISCLVNLFVQMQYRRRERKAVLLSLIHLLTLFEVARWGQRSFGCKQCSIFFYLQQGQRKPWKLTKAQRGVSLDKAKGRFLQRNKGPFIWRQGFLF